MYRVKIYTLALIIINLLANECLANKDAVMDKLYSKVELLKPTEGFRATYKYNQFYDGNDGPFEKEYKKIIDVAVLGNKIRVSEDKVDSICYIDFDKNQLDEISKSSGRIRRKKIEGHEIYSGNVPFIVNEGPLPWLFLYTRCRIYQDDPNSVYPCVKTEERYEFKNNNIEVNVISKCSDGVGILKHHGVISFKKYSNKDIVDYYQHDLDLKRREENDVLNSKKQFLEWKDYGYVVLPAKVIETAFGKKVSRKGGIEKLEENTTIKRSYELIEINQLKDKGALDLPTINKLTIVQDERFGKTIIYHTTDGFLADEKIIEFINYPERLEEHNKKYLSLRLEKD
ncbi:MAG: hypothetical protein NZM04_11170 [Methylacidiphilales bacterium]|nr:hypothetical protein [Candidatus Methylacidiphilales bacterium]